MNVEVQKSRDKNGIKEMFEEMLPENFQNWLKTSDRVWENYKPQQEKHKEYYTFAHNGQIAENQRQQEHARGSQRTKYVREATITFWVDFSTETMASRRYWRDILKSWKNSFKFEFCIQWGSQKHNSDIFKHLQFCQPTKFFRAISRISKELYFKSVHPDHHVQWSFLWTHVLRDSTWYT